MRQLLYIGFISILASSLQCRKSNAGMDPSILIYPNAQSNKTFLALGDSYTIGQSVEAGERFPMQTVSLLRSNGIQLTDPFYIAATGWTTDDLSTAIAIQGPRPVYNAVTLLIGVNDQFQRHDTSGYRERFSGLLNTAIAYAGNLNDHVFVLSIPDYSVTPAAGNYDTAFIRKQVNEFNDINRSVTMQQHCNYLDITPSTREALTDSTLIANDGLHPSGKEYHKWALRLSALMYPVLR